MVKFEKELSAEKEAKDEELAAKVRAATFAQVQAKLDADEAILSKRCRNKEREAMETAADVVYVKNRQRIL